MLTDQVAVVTGSTRGIGKATAIALAGAGASLIINSRQKDARASIAKAVVETMGTDVKYVEADISQPSQVEALVVEAWEWKGKVDIWINNAGADILSSGRWHSNWESRLQALISTDVWGTIRCCRLNAERMAKIGSGQIINVGWDQAESGSVATDSGQFFSLVKGGIIAYSRALAGAVAPDVRVNCVAPGWIETEWGEEVSRSFYETIQNEVPLKRWGRPEDVAQAILWLCEPAASYVTGQTIYVNGGLRT